MTDRVTAAYLAECLDSTSALRALRDGPDFSSVLSERVADRVFPRPVFMDEPEIQRFAADATQIFNLITSLPDRLFGNDLARYCAELRVPENWIPLLTRLGGGKPPLYGRADMYHDGTSFKLLEFNIESNLGGIDTAGEIPRKFLEDEAFASFADEHGLTYTHPGEALAETLREIGAKVSGGGEPVVALLDGREGLADEGADSYALQRYMSRRGLRFHVGALDEIEKHGERIRLRGECVDVVLRDFAVQQIAYDETNLRSAELIFQAHLDGTAVLWTPLESTLFSNKGCLAMLSDPRFRSAYSPAELEVIDRVVPWTRALTEDTPPDVIAECWERKNEIIMKPNLLHGGKGIVAGWACDDREWDEILLVGMHLGYVAQQRVVPRREPVVNPVTGTVEDWAATWGLFLTPAGYAGTFIRLQPEGSGAVISIAASPDARVAGLFTGTTVDHDPSDT